MYDVSDEPLQSEVVEPQGVTKPDELQIGHQGHESQGLHAVKGTLAFVFEAQNGLDLLDFFSDSLAMVVKSDVPVGSDPSLQIADQIGVVIAGPSMTTGSDQEASVRASQRGNPLLLIQILSLIHPFPDGLVERTALSEFGCPGRIRVDNGSQFTSKELDLWA